MKNKALQGENFYLYVDFNSKTIGYNKNTLDYVPGETLTINGNNCIVYSLLNLNQVAVYILDEILKKNLLKKADNFCQVLNMLVEYFIKISKLTTDEILNLNRSTKEEIKNFLG